MDGRLREATTAEISLALGKLLRALPPRRVKPEELEESYLIACHKASNHALQTVVVKLIRGELDGLSKSYAPSPAELSSAIRAEMDFVRRQIELAQDRMKIEDNRPIAIRRPSIVDRIRQLEADMQEASRPFLQECSHQEFIRMRSLPVGCTWKLGRIYGPPGHSAPAPQAEEVEW